MERTRAYRRDVRKRTIKRKKRICKKMYGRDWYNADGKYSKGKIHCGCKLCKYEKYYGIPTIREMRENEYVKYCMEHYDKVEDEG